MENRQDLKRKLKVLIKTKEDLEVVQQALLHPYIYPQNLEEPNRVNKELFIIRQKIKKIKTKLLELGE